MVAATTSATETTTRRTGTSGASGDHADPRRWWTLGVLCLSLLIIFVGNTTLNVALPQLSEQLHATGSELQWVIAAYSLTFAGLLFTTGALGDRYGRKGMLQLGLVGFLLSAVLASLAHDMTQLIVCRALMGASAAMIMPATLSILVNVFPPAERARAIAIWATTAGVAGFIGPIGSGWLLAHFWYGSVFLVNVPILIAALVGGYFFVPKSCDPEHGKLDPIGALLSIVGVSSLVFGLIEAPSAGWTSSEVLLAFGLSVFTLAVFVAWELHVTEPMLDMHFFRVPAFTTGTGGLILVFMAMAGVMFLMSQYFQLVLGYSPLSAALRFAPMAPIMLLISPRTPRLAARYGTDRVAATGMFLLALSFIMFRSLEPDTSYAYVLLCMVPLMVGMSLVMSPMTAAIMSAVPARRAGAGSAVNDATRELGTSLGVAVLGSIAVSHFSSAMEPAVRALPPGARATAGSSLGGALQAAAHLPPAAGRALTAVADHAWVGGIHTTVTVGAILALIAGVAVLRFLPAHLPQEASLHGPVAALEEAAELGLGGVPVAFADTFAAVPDARGHVADAPAPAEPEPAPTG